MFILFRKFIINNINIIRILIFCFILSLMVSSSSWASVIGVVSSSASSNGRPFIWQNRDNPNSYKQEIHFDEFDAPATGRIITVRGEMSATLDTTVINTGGVNETGFAIAYATVAQLTYSYGNFNLLDKALKQCETLADFEFILQNTWYALLNGNISANYVVIDSYGGAALYEVVSISDDLFYAHIDYVKYNANDGSIINNNGDIISPASDENNGIVVHGKYFQTLPNNILIPDDAPIREARAMELMGALSENNELNFRSMMQQVAKDVCGDQEKTNPTSFNTSNCISTYRTNYALVIDGVTPGSNETRFCTMWCNLGEPSVGTCIPVLPFAGDISFYTYLDFFDNETNEPYGSGSSCLINRTFDDRETNNLYSNNVSSQKINYSELTIAQGWTFPLENLIFDKTEAFLSYLRENPQKITEGKVFDFSCYCAYYVWLSYNDIEYTTGQKGLNPWKFYWNAVVNYTNPQNEIEGASINSDISVLFSESMDPGTINSNSFFLSDSTGIVSGSVSYEDSSRTALFNPDYNLKYSTMYTAAVTNDIKDVSGYPLSYNIFVWSFTTEHEPDYVPPVILSTNPKIEIDKVEIDIAITVEFNESMDAFTIDESSFMLFDGSDFVVGKVTYNDFNYTALFTPEVALKYSTIYNARISDEVKDVSGNAIAESYSFTFTTGEESLIINNDYSQALDEDTGSGGLCCGLDANAYMIDINKNSNAGLKNILSRLTSIFTTMLIPFLMILLHRFNRKKRRCRLTPQ